MRLDSVDIFGFKSFGERAELSFRQEVTAIVGPNGCGKSNISDAIGWALGEQSAKSLRGKKMEDLIFTGSESRSPVSVAEVNLHLSQVNGNVSEPRPQVVVTRRLYRSGESEYLMDGRACRLRDIHEIFMDTGVGTKAYSIIEQGKIGLILSSKPSDRRGLIEEAAGITKYKVRRRSAELKLQAAQQNLLRVNDIVYEVERQMNSLKRQAGKARRYRRLRDAMSHLEKIAAVKKSRELQSRLRLFRGKLQTVSDEELRRSTSLVTAETYLERLRLEQAERDTAVTDGRDRLHQMELAIERLDNQIARDREQLTDLAARDEQLGAELGELEERYGPASEQLKLRIKDEGEVTEKLARSEEAGAFAQQELNRGTVSVAEAEQEIEEGRAELVHRISKIAALNNFLQGVMAHSEKVSSELLKLDEEVRELEAERERLDKRHQESSAELAARQEVARSLAAERENLEGELTRLRTERDRVQLEIARRREEHSELTGRLASLEELVKARAHFGAGARALLTAGPELGIRTGGSVSDAIEVEPRFERAAERFYSDRLQHIIVANEVDALAAEAHLEAEKIGRCDFLIESLAETSPPSNLEERFRFLSGRGVEGLVGPLSGAVDWTNGKRELLSRSLPDAIVVERLDDALRAFRLEPNVAFVTLGGEVLEPPGVLRVGPGGPGEGLLTTRREIREIGETLSRSTEELNGLERSYQEVANELERRNARMDSLAGEMHTLEKELVGLEHQRQQLDEEDARAGRKGEVLTSEHSRAVSERESLGTKREEMEAGLVVEEEAKANVEARLGELRFRLSERRTGLEELQSKAAEDASRVAALRERAHAVRVDVERLGEGVRELESRISASRREKLELAERRSGLRDDLAGAEVKVKTLLGDRDELARRLTIMEEQASRLRSRVEVTEAALKLRRTELESVREARSSQEIAVTREELEMDHLRKGFLSGHGISLEEAHALLSPTELDREDDDLETELEELKQKLDTIGPVNPMADEEYRELETRFEFLTTQRQDLLDSISSTESAIGRIDTESRQRFEAAFEKINQYFDITFKQLFGGGRAGLSLIDEEDLLDSGVDIIAQPPGKKLQNVLLLSGGEKALTAISLMFAIFRFKPSPFCLLDEVDAPLDDANVGRFLTMLAELRKTTQFIIITHNRKTMEIADQMYGVTMEEPGISKLVSVNLVEAGTRQAVAAPA